MNTGLTAKRDNVQRMSMRRRFGAFYAFSILGIACQTQRMLPQRLAASDAATQPTATQPTAAQPADVAVPSEDCVASDAPRPDSTLSSTFPEFLVVIAPGGRACLVRDPKGAWIPVAQAPAQVPHLNVRMTVDKATTVLAIHNCSRGRLTYRAAIKNPNQSSWSETDVVPVMPGLLGFETWSGPIEELALLSIRTD